MQAIWYFDFISPFAYLQLSWLRGLRERVEVTPVPIVFGAVLSHHGQLGPAEIAGKREFTYRHVQWQADAAGIALRFPPAHPFNSLAALRLCVACGSSWEAVETIFARVWREGGDATTGDALATTARALGIDDANAAIAEPGVKQTLRENTEHAIARGVFGVPTLALGDLLFWGNDASAMVDAWLREPALFDEARYVALRSLPSGVDRRR